MDLFDHPYYRLNKFLMIVLGQWPNQKNLAKICCRVAVIYFTVSEILCRMRTIYNHHDDIDIMRECTIEMFIQLVGVTPFLSLMLNSQTTLKLLNHIRMDWQVWAEEREVNILREHTELGKNLNITFAALMYLGGALVLIQPVIEKIIDVFLRNGTAPGKFVLMVDYYHVDEQKYYFYVIAYFYLALAVMGASVLTNIVMLISYTVHGSGLFAALRYVNLMEAAFRWNFFITTGLGIILANGLGLLMLTQRTNIQLMVSSMGIVLLLALCFMIECASSQTLIDHSISIRVYIHNSHWYNLTPKAQKLLPCMIMRSHSPSQLTAGNILIMSNGAILQIFKATLSYFAVVRSTQGV